MSDGCERVKEKHYLTLLVPSQFSAEKEKEKKCFLGNFIATLEREIWSHCF